MNLTMSYVHDDCFISSFPVFTPGKDLTWKNEAHGDKEHLLVSFLILGQSLQYFTVQIMFTTSFLLIFFIELRKFLSLQFADFCFLFLFLFYYFWVLNFINAFFHPFREPSNSLLLFCYCGGLLQFDEGTKGKLRAKHKPNTHPPLPGGMYATFLRHSWLPKNKGKERKQMFNW